MAKKRKEDAADIAERLKEVLAKSSGKARSVAIEVCTDILVEYQNQTKPKSLKKLKRIIKKSSYDKVKIGSPAVKPSRERRKQIEDEVKSVVKKDSAKSSKKRKQD